MPAPASALALALLLALAFAIPAPEPAHREHRRAHGNDGLEAAVAESWAGHSGAHPGPQERHHGPHGGGAGGRRDDPGLQRSAGPPRSHGGSQVTTPGQHHARSSDALSKEQAAVQGKIRQPYADVADRPMAPLTPGRAMTNKQVLPYATAPRQARLELFAGFSPARFPWHWTDFSRKQLDLPDSGPPWRVAFDAAAPLRTRSELSSAVFVRLGDQVKLLVPPEPAGEVLPNGPPKSATVTLQAMLLTMQRTKCFLEQCSLYPQVPANSSLDWMFLHGIDTLFESPEDKRMTMVLAGTHPFAELEDLRKNELLVLKHTAPSKIELAFPPIVPGELSPGRRVYINIVRAPFPRATSDLFHRAHYLNMTLEEAIDDFQKFRALELLPQCIKDAYSRDFAPLDVRRRTYYIQSEVLFNDVYKPHAIADMARFMFGADADTEHVQKIVAMMTDFKLPRMNHGMQHPSFAKIMSEQTLRRTTKFFLPDLPEMLQMMYPTPKTLAGPFVVRLCNINAFLWELEDTIDCDYFGRYDLHKK